MTNKLSFKATIGDVHFNSKKGEVKIALTATSYVSLDKLSNIAPSGDESITITLESAQTTISDATPSPPLELKVDKAVYDDRVDSSHILGKEEAKPLREAAARLRGEDGKGELEDKEAPIVSNEDPGDRV